MTTAITDLVERLEQARYAYYNNTHAPTCPQAKDAKNHCVCRMSDAAFDALEADLKRLDPQNPYFDQHGAVPAGGWAKHKHQVPMGSLNKATTGAEFAAWFASCLALLGKLTQAVEVFITEKLDGGSLSLYYKDGVLMRGVTRGRNGIGEVITRNVRLMQGVPHKLATKFTGYVRGEIILYRSEFEKHFKDPKDPNKSNPRNSANGTAKRQSDPGPCKHLMVMCYQMLPDSGKLPSKEAEFEALKAAGFTVPHYAKVKAQPGEDLSTAVCKAVEHVYGKYIGGIRAKLDYDIDGLVCYINDNDQHDACGEEAHNPKASIAFKFPSDAAKTKLRSIVRQVGQSGRITAVAHFDAVNLAGANVRRASLHNEGNIRRISQQGAKRDHLAVGDEILVARRNDVIPYVEALVTPVERQTPSGKAPQVDVLDLFSADDPTPALDLLTTPSVCPECQTKLVMDGEYLLCPNKTGCPAQTMGAVMRWLDKLGILDWGDTLVQALCESGKVTTPADLYKLTEADLANVVYSSGVRHGDSRAKTCYDNLHAKKDITLDLFVGSLGIPMWGRSMTQVVVRAGFDTLGKLTVAKVADLAKIKAVGDTKAEAFIEGFRGVYPQIYALLDAGVAIVPPVQGALTGKTVCFTGFRDADLVEAIEAAGGTYKDGYSRAITYLVAKDPNEGSTKLLNARKNGTTVISVDDMWNLVGGGPV